MGRNILLLLFFFYQIQLYSQSIDTVYYQGKIFSISYNYRDSLIEKTYYESGKINSITRKNAEGLEYGLSEGWYESGKKRFNHFYDGENNSSYCIVFYESGAKLEEVFYKKGVTLKMKSWYEDGKMKYVQILRSDSSYFGIGYHHDGYISNYSEKRFVNGRDINIYESYYENGQLISMVNTDSLIQYNRGYYKNGQLMREGNIQECMYSIGLHKEYHKNGQLKSEGNYFEDIDNEPEYANSKVGSWKYWDENGKLIKEEKWEKGKLLKEKNY